MQMRRRCSPSVTNLDVTGNHTRAVPDCGVGRGDPVRRQSAVGIGATNPTALSRVRITSGDAVKAVRGDLHHAAAGLTHAARSGRFKVVQYATAQSISPKTLSCDQIRRVPRPVDQHDDLEVASDPSRPAFLTSKVFQDVRKSPLFVSCWYRDRDSDIGVRRREVLAYQWNLRRLEKYWPRGNDATHVEESRLQDTSWTTEPAVRMQLPRR